MNSLARRWTFSTLLLLTIVCPASARADGPAEVTITNVQGKSATLTAQSLADAPRATLTAKDRDGQEHRFEGVEIHELLKRVEVSTGEDLRGPRMRELVTIEGADGYSVAYSIGELSPKFTDRKILLADRIDGMPLAAETGPYRVIVEGDKRHSRWVRNVARIRVLDSAQLVRPAQDR